jgi:predicted dehydrogenase
MSALFKRRDFIKSGSLGVAGLVLGAGSGLAAARKLSANDKLNIGVIGVAARGGENLAAVGATENIVALCDVDEQRLNAAAQKYPDAKLYRDFRRLIDQRDIDAIVVSTPDHTHAVAAVGALKSGRHLYCEKPLARTISETRIITDLARKTKLVTQLGTQIHAGANYHASVELIQSGAIGPVSEVHAWVDNSWGGKDRATDLPPVPAHLDYDLWLGPSPFVRYHPEHLHRYWRQWWAFGGGSLGDFGCHFMDLPHWALNLRTPLSVQAEGPPVHAHSTPPWLIVRYEYPARGDKPPVKLTWYHGGRQPDLLSPELLKKWRSGVLFVGDKGRMLLADYNRRLLLPEAEFKDVAPAPKVAANRIGHHQEWIRACKTGEPTSCPFDYSGPLTESVLLGNVAYRAGERIEWDSKRLRARNCRDAEQFIQHHYRKGWRI